MIIWPRFRCLYDGAGYHTGVIRSGFPGYTVITPSPSRTRETASTAAPRQQSYGVFLVVCACVCARAGCVLAVVYICAHLVSGHDRGTRFKSFTPLFRRYRSPAKLPIESAGEGTTTAATPFQHPTEGSGRQAVAATPPRFAKPYRTGIIKSNGKGRTKVIMVAGDESSGARGGSSGAGAGRAQRREPYRSSTIRWKGNGATSAGFTSPEKWPTPRGTAGIPMPISRPAEGVAPY